jgi:hypothetical protein
MTLLLRMNSPLSFRCVSGAVARGSRVSDEVKE